MSSSGKKLFKYIFLLTFFVSLIYLFLRVKGPVRTNRLRVDDLMRRSRSELDEAFLAGETPTMEEMEGIVNGNVMAGVSLLNDQYFRNFLNLGWFMWRGKVFENVTSIEGKGINRFKVGPFRFLRYHCETRITPPLVETDNVYHLNYDLPGNPWYIRQIRDDIKKIGDGLFLGSANFKISGKHKFLVYFVLESATA